MSAGEEQLDELAGILERFLDELGQPVRAGEAMAVGWATVDRDRAFREITDRWPTLPPFAALRDDVLLGASAFGTVAPVIRKIRLVLVEPSTEGRMAASLARRGEGPVAVWVAAPAVPGTRLSGVAAGPFGPERLVLGGALNGPHVLLLDRAPGTIER